MGLGVGRDEDVEGRCPLLEGADMGYFLFWDDLHVVTSYLDGVLFWLVNGSW